MLKYILFAVALSLSAVAAFYAVVGLTAIFAASFIAIAIMGFLLEVSKLVVASYLYQRWREINKAMKAYFTSALVILICLTSMGVYGFLANAHSGQEAQFNTNSVEIASIERQIEISERKLKPIYEAIDNLNEYDKVSGDQGVFARLTEYDQTIRTEETRITNLQSQKATLEREQSTATAKLGPIKYIAELFGWQDTAAAFRIVSLAIVFVLDPLAILLLIAANREFKKNTKKEEKQNPPSFENKPRIPTKPLLFTGKKDKKTKEDILLENNNKTESSKNKQTIYGPRSI